MGIALATPPALRLPCMPRQATQYRPVKCSKNCKSRTRGCPAAEDRQALADSRTLRPPDTRGIRSYRPIPWGGRAASRYPAACNLGIKIATAATVWLRVTPPPS